MLGCRFDEGDWALPVMFTEEVLAEVGIGYSPIQYACYERIGDEAWVQHGDQFPDEEALLHSGWQSFSEHLKHRSRFLFETEETVDDYGAVERLGTRDFLDTLLQAILASQARIVLDSSSVLYRARAFAERNELPRATSEYTSPPLCWAWTCSASGWAKVDLTNVATAG